LSVRRHRKSNKFIGEANVCEDAIGIVVEVQESARLEIEDSGALFAKRSSCSQLLEEGGYEDEGARASVFHSGGFAFRTFRMNLSAP
jgi:hypothetical protein